MRGGPKCPGRLERVSDGTNSALHRRTNERPQHTCEHVGVLVSVNVGWVNTAMLETLYLSHGFGFDFSLRDVSPNKVKDKSFQGRAKCAIWGECGNAAGGERRLPVDQDYMTADPCTERRSAGDSFIGVAGSSHQRG